MSSGQQDLARPAPATWRSLLGESEFRGLWAAHAISLTGDQLARVALAVLVFDRTRSALLTAAVYAITFLPWLLGGPLLSGVGDRYPRRTVMIACSVGSAGLVVALALPGLPLPVLCGLLFLVILLESPFLSARAALLVDVLPDDRYVLASALGNLTLQAAQVAGFAAGGLVVAAIGPRPALLVDSATFLAAAVLIRRCSPRRPAAGSQQAAGSWAARIGTGARVVFGDARLRRLVILAWLATFWIAPEGLAAPYAAALGGGASTVGLLLAAPAAGTVAGGLVVSRLIGPDRRRRLLVPLTALGGVPLLVCAADPPLVVVLAVLAISGVGLSYQIIANAAFMQAVPAGSRAQAFGLAAAGLAAGQGLGLLAAGLAAERLGPQLVVAGAGASGLLLLAAVAVRPVPAVALARTVASTD